MRRRWVMNVGVAAAIAIAAWFAGQGMHAETPANSQTSGGDLAKIDLAYNENALKLAETELQILVSANEKLPNMFPKVDVDRARAIVALAKWRLDHVRKNVKVAEYENYLVAAEADAKIAQLSYDTSVAANKRIANAVTPLDLEALRLRAELGKLRVERVRAAKTQPDLVMLRWQIQDLRDQIARLTTEVELYRGNQ
jgi:hypothetical protein